MGIEKKFEREVIPKRVGTRWGNAVYVGVYRSCGEGSVYVYRLDKVCGDKVYVELSERGMGLLLEEQRKSGEQEVTISDNFK